MNSLVGFGSIAAFIISAVRLFLDPEIEVFLWYDGFSFQSIPDKLVVSCRFHFLTRSLNGMHPSLMNR